MRSRFWSCLVIAFAPLLVCNPLIAQTGADGNANTGVRPLTQDDDEDDQLPQLPQQSVEVNEDRSGWDAAGTGKVEGRLSETLRANWVMVDANGLLRGTVIGFEGKAVTDVVVKLIRNGQVINSTAVNAQGQFSFNNVQQGTYGLVGFGEEHFFAFGFDAIRNSNNPKANAARSITVMAGPNATTINTDWISFFGPKVKYRVYGRFLSKEGSDDPARLYGTEGLSVHYPAAVPSTTIQSHAVTALSDGRLIGRVHQIDSLNGRPVDVRNTRVLLLKDDDIYAATSTDNYGVFEYTDIEAGFYTIVAAGDDGLAAIGLEVVKTEPSSTNDPEFDAQVVPIDLALLPSESTGWMSSFAAEAAYQRALAASARFNAQRNGCNCPPFSQADQEALIRALQPSKRGRFWKRLNKYFDQVVYGEDAAGGPATNQYQQGYNPYGYAPGTYPYQGYPNQGCQGCGGSNQVYPNQGYPYYPQGQGYGAPVYQPQQQVTPPAFPPMSAAPRGVPQTNHVSQGQRAGQVK